ncbi:MAG: hypothetical protein JXB38_10160 [Anaerolineales bacterium]|nr:hypothetical protein [Anaerolineales bacterium]
MRTMEKVAYQGWENCYKLSNGKVELIITGDIGPRLIRFGFVGGENEFGEFTDMVGKTGGDEWRIYGGHRFWHAPEDKVRTYYPDNDPVEVTDMGAFVRVVQRTEGTTGIQKELDIYLSDTEAQVKVVHRLRNHNLWPVELAPWGVSVMATGGVAIVPLPPRGSHEENLLPANTLTFWPYVDMSDSRWTWGHKYVMLRQDVGMTAPQKFGAMGLEGKAAYARNGHLFIKTFPYIAEAAYPDFNCAVEVFTNEQFLEVETLGPVVNLMPGGTVEHVEQWYLFDDVPLPTNEAEVEAHVAPKLAAV